MKQSNFILEEIKIFYGTKKMQNITINRVKLSQLRKKNTKKSKCALIERKIYNQRFQARHLNKKKTHDCNVKNLFVYFINF